VPHPDRAVHGPRGAEVAGRHRDDERHRHDVRHVADLAGADRAVLRLRSALHHQGHRDDGNQMTAMRTAQRTRLGGEHRWTQLTFVENDPLDFDLDAWADVMDRTASTAVCISAGGYVAYYPTKVALHHRSIDLGDRDLLGEVVDLARSRGMAVMARVDPHAVHQDVADQRPEWIARTEDGGLREHWAMPGIYLTDAFGGYSWELTTEVLREIAREYDV